MPIQESVTKRPYGASRVAAIDAARGATMLFVCLAHFADSYQFTSGADSSGGYLVIVGMIASPTFVTMSGLVAGFLAVTRANSFAALRYKLFDRGLFLLVVGHVILAASGLAMGRSFTGALKIGYITDAIGLSVMVGPWLVERLNARVRLFIALGTYVISWIGILAWTASPGSMTVLKHYLIGTPNAIDWSAGDFPLIPWFAVYIAGTVLGGQIGKLYRDQRLKDGNFLLARIGVAILVVGATGKVAFALMRHFAPALLVSYSALTPLLSSYQKFPPGPVYLTFFGGTGMILAATILEASRRGIMPWLIAQLRQIGLASLFVYVLQFHVYVVVIRSLKLPYSPLWPVLFLFSVAFLTLAAKAWNSHEGNRFLTVGIGPLIEWRARQRLRANVRNPISETAALVGGGATRGVA